MNTLTNIESNQHTSLKRQILFTQFAQAYLKHHRNGTKAYLELKPHVGVNTAATRASELVSTSEVQAEIKRLVQEADEQAIRTKAEIINNMARIGEKAEKSKAYTPALNAWKEIGQLSNAYDRDEDNAGKYNTFIQNLTVNVGAKPQDVVLDQDNQETVEAQWSDILDNQEVTEQD